MTVGREPTVDTLHPLARRALAGLEPYIPGRSAEEVTARYGIREPSKLGSNENPLGLSPRARGALIAALDRIHHYPDPDCSELKRLIAGRLGVTPANLCLANGVDNVLTCLGLAFLDPGDRCVVAAPTYTAYASRALLLGAMPVEVPLTAWRVDVDAMAAAADGAKALIVCNPNNPTGTIVGQPDIDRLLARVSQSTLVVLDEAYAEWVDDPAFPDGPTLARRHDNLVVLRTFSKIYGLAGLRVGYAVASPGLVACMERVREPFAVDRLAQAAAEAVLGDDDYLRSAFENNRAGRAFLGRAFAEMNLESLPSQANFVLVNLGRPAADVAEQLLPRGVIIRPGALWKLPTWARVTVGTAGDNIRLVSALADVLGRPRPAPGG